MRIRLLSVAVIFLLVGALHIVNAQSSPGNSAPQTGQDVERVLRDKDQGLLDAIAPGDTKTWDTALAPRAIYIDENGAIIPRDEFLKQLTPLPAGASGSIKISAYQVELHGDVAVVIHTDDENENYHGQQLTAQYLTSETWQETGSDWKLLAVHTYAVLRDPPAITLTAAELDSYAGKYVTGDLIYTIRREDDHLVGVREGRPPAQLVAEVRDVFFVKGQPRSRKIFQRDTNGQVAGFSDRREGVDIVWKKVAAVSQ